MDEIVQKKVDEIVSQNTRKSMRKPSGQIVQKTPLRQAFEKFFEVDASDLWKDLKVKGKYALFSISADVLNNAVDSLFRRKKPTRNDYGPGVITRSFDNPSYKTPYSRSSSSYVGAQTTKHTFSDLIYSRRSDAEDLLAAMREAIRDNGSLSVTELYDGIGDPRLLGSLESTDSSIGWKDLSDAYVAEENGMYRVFVPKLVSLK